MNQKIKNYVDVLFGDIPQTKKAVELKEEILSNLNEHFEALVAEGKSENQAYTESLADMGDIDGLLESLAPERELKPRIDEFRRKRASITAVAVSIYILGGVLFLALPGVASVFGSIEEHVERFGIIGLLLMLVCVAIATAMLVYINMSVPQDVAPYLEEKKSFNCKNDRSSFWASFFKLYWLVTTIVYLLVSFTTGAWHISWIIFMIAAAVRQALIMFLNIPDEDK